MVEHRTRPIIRFGILLGLAAGGLMVVGGVVGAGVDAAYAQEAQEGSKKLREEMESRKVDSLRSTVYEDIAAAQTLLEEGGAESKQEAIQDLRDLMEDDLNDYERGIVEQIFASIAIDEGDYGRAIGHYEQILALENVPVSLDISALQALGQLYLAEEEYEKSIQMVTEWLTFQKDPGPQPYIWLAQAYYGMENWEKILETTDVAITLARERGAPIQENWYLLQRLAHFERGDMEKVAEILEILAVNWDKPEYWKQLSAAYAELDMREKQLAALEVAYRRGFLDKESELINLAQLYMFHEVPIKAAWVLEDGMDREIVEKNGENYATLGQAYLNAAELEKAEDPLRQAAQMQEDGELWMRLGQVFVEREQWEEAIPSLTNAADSEDLDEPGYAYMLLGQAYFNTAQFDKAVEQFRNATRRDVTEDNARKWIQYTRKEVQRREQLSEYYGDGGSGGE